MRVLAHSLFIPTAQNREELNLPASLKRRAPRIWKLAYAAATEAVAQTTIKPESIIVGTALGALDETVRFIEKIHTSNMGSPRQFIASVHNSMSGMLAMELGITGTNLTICESTNSTAAAIHAARFIPESTVLIVIVDEQLPLLEKIYHSCSNNHYFTEGTQEGALAIVLDHTDSRFPQLSATATQPCTVPSTQSGTLFSTASDLADLLDKKYSGTIDSYSPTANCSARITVKND